MQQFLRNAVQGLVSVCPSHSSPGLMQFSYRDYEQISINFSSNSLSLPHSRSIGNHPLSYANQDLGPLSSCHSSFSRPSGVCDLLLTINNYYYYPGNNELSQKALLNNKRISIETVVKNAMSFFFFFFFQMPLMLFLKYLTSASLSSSLIRVSLIVCLQPFFSFHIFISKPKTDTARQAAALPTYGSAGII